MQLSDFLLQRIAEDEAAAREIPDGAWEDACSETRRYDHVFLWSPARVLAECEAKRRIVDLHYNPRFPEKCEVCAWAVGSLDSDHDPMPCDTLHALALPFRDHPDYDPAWEVS